MSNDQRFESLALEGVLQERPRAHHPCKESHKAWRLVFMKAFIDSVKGFAVCAFAGWGSGPYELQKVFATSRKGRGYPNSFSSPLPFFGWRLVLQHRAIFM